eukprot:TRINITY_DN14601_c0_g1_i1.p1 TRINITY_DN14601_c0_g1~~TRINITY_DN14601_c0_g1_i1.p1  ORF type:complete len:140 (-),score=28.58 TRINITY_DN14601_c0_g1_i1:42-461(-)
MLADDAEVRKRALRSTSDKMVKNKIVPKNPQTQGQLQVQQIVPPQQIQVHSLSNQLHPQQIPQFDMLVPPKSELLKKKRRSSPGVVELRREPLKATLMSIDDEAPDGSNDLNSSDLIEDPLSDMEVHFLGGIFLKNPRN